MKWLACSYDELMRIPEGYWPVLMEIVTEYAESLER